MKEYLLSPYTTLKEALTQMDKAACKTLFVINEDEHLLGSLSDGDIRRSILKGDDLKIEVDFIMNKRATTVSELYDINEVKKIFINNRYEALPVINNQNRIVDILFWNDIFQKKTKIFRQLKLPVIIMAGGKGTRMDPFTKVLPKPLIPIGEKPIIEIIMDNYANYGMTSFFITLNYKGKMVQAYFEDHNSNYKFTYVYENTLLGSAGSIKLIENQINDHFFVSNCDTIINDDYSTIYDFHVNSGFDLTAIGSVQHYQVPFGVFKIQNGGLLKSIIERPTYDYIVNTGMYLLSPSVFDYIPSNESYSMVELIETLKNNSKKVGVFPISEKSWIDVGQWDEYKRAARLLKF